MRKRVADRCAQIGESPTVALNDLVKGLRADGIPILDFGSGDPDFGTPEHVSASAIAALHAGRTHYPPSRGVPELRRAIADKLWRDNAIAANPDTCIIVTPSSKHALFIALMTILNPGDEILIPTPSWGSYQAMARLAGALPVPVPLDPADDFGIAYQRLAAHVTGKTKALLINTPNNPTGRVLREREAAAIEAFAETFDLLVVADEIYEKIIHKGKHLSLAARPGCAERTLTVNGFSKGYAMPGWRLGYIAGSADIIEPMLVIHQHTVAAAGSFTQVGGTAALIGDQRPVQAMVAEYSTRVEFVVRQLNAMPGVACRMPGGAFYVFPDIRGTGMGDSVRVAKLLLSEANVVVTPGTAFGAGGEGHIRMSCTAPMDVLEDGLARIAGVLSSAVSADAVTHLR